MNNSLLRFTNSLTGIKETFKPLEKNSVKMYVCGITPYDFAHVGHARVYIVFDVIYRLLQTKNYIVTYCRNFTDIDDKLLQKAATLHGDKMAYKTVATAYINAFHEDMKALNCEQPTYEPLVTEHIPQIINFIAQLVANNTAYVVDSDVYFSVNTYSPYGQLSKQKLDELQSGIRVEYNDKKRSPLDFALWKGEEDGSFWKSPWGYGRPGWHIECSALAYHYLGKQIDIHGGGADLAFPHHENERAQTESFTNFPFAQFWLHNAFVQINKEKMSKSLGNFFTIKEILKKYDPMVLRFMMLNHHYRSPIDFSLDDLASLEKSYQKLCNLLQNVHCACQNHDFGASAITAEMIAFINDDLNTVGVLGVIFKNSKTIKDDAAQACLVKTFVTKILGLTLSPVQQKSSPITAEIQSLIDEREQARNNKDWARADQIRKELQALGFTVHDKKSID